MYHSAVLACGVSVSTEDFANTIDDPSQFEDGIKLYNDRVAVIYNKNHNFVFAFIVKKAYFVNSEMIIMQDVNINSLILSINDEDMLRQVLGILYEAPSLKLYMYEN